MNKTTELKNTKALVKTILEQDQRARNSDSFLYFRVLGLLGEEKGVDMDLIPVTILSANKEVAEQRAENEEAYRDFARERSVDNG